MHEQPCQADCIFCKIVAGDIPSLRVFENEHLVAFLDISPIAPGHTIVIPRGHYARLDDMPAEVARDLFASIPELSRAVRDGMGAEGLNLLVNNGRVAGQVVDHVHVHLIPRREADGLGFRWPASSYGEGEAESVREKIVSVLS